jgi:hypothetical protein
VVGVLLVALEAVREGGGLTVLVLTQYKALAALFIVIVVLWSFAYNETGEGMSRRGGWMTLVKMGDKVDVDSGIGKMMVGI